MFYFSKKKCFLYREKYKITANNWLYYWIFVKIIMNIELITNSLSKFGIKSERAQGRFANEGQV